MNALHEALDRRDEAIRDLIKATEPAVMELVICGGHARLRIAAKLKKEADNAQAIYVNEAREAK